MGRGDVYSCGLEAVVVVHVTGSGWYDIVLERRARLRVGVRDHRDWADERQRGVACSGGGRIHPAMSIV
jgi:hypothetical protein